MVEGSDAVELRAQRRLLSWQTCVVVVLLAGVTTASVVAVSSVAATERDRALAQRSTEVSALYTAALGEVHSALVLLTSVATPSSLDAFQTASRSLLAGNVRAVGQVEQVDSGAFELVSGVGDVPSGAFSAGQLAVLRRATAADDLVAGVVQAADGKRIMYALLGADHRIVYREVAIDPTKPATTIRGQVFSDIDVTLYASRTADPDAITTSTRATPLTSGHMQTIPIGADSWLLVTTARGSLAGTIAGGARWVTLGSGLVLTLAIGALVEIAARRRRYALRLVAERTGALEQALHERKILEVGQRAARDEAEAANRAKSEFLSRMSHELRTPLNGVLGFAQLLEMEPLTEPQLDSVHHIMKGGWHLLDLINEVLDITRIESGTSSLSPEAVLASEVLLESVDLIRPLAAQRGIHLVSAGATDCDAFVFADRQRVKQILLNLLSNAIKYNRSGGSVAITCTSTDRALTLHVADTGPGIRPEHLDLLFVPFERLGAENSEIEGTGIGLALSRRLAEAMAGTLTVETDLGRGSTFSLTLPIVEGPVERYVRIGQPVTVAAPSSGRHRVLYVEDNLANMRLVERLLGSRTDVELVAAMQGRLGLELARQHLPSAILLDLHLPDMDGTDLLHQLLHDPVTARIPVIVVSADATIGQVARLKSAGAYAYLTKPLDVPNFIRLLDEIFAAEAAAETAAGMAAAEPSTHVD